jgi:hypothetical protein
MRDDESDSNSEYKLETSGIKRTDGRDTNKACVQDGNTKARLE